MLAHFPLPIGLSTHGSRSMSALYCWHYSHCGKCRPYRKKFCSRGALSTRQQRSTMLARYHARQQVSYDRDGPRRTGMVHAVRFWKKNSPLACAITNLYCPAGRPTRKGWLTTTPTGIVTIPRGYGESESMRHSMVACNLDRHSLLGRNHRRPYRTPFGYPRTPRGLSHLCNALQKFARICA
jgi:hypothetical protein